MKVLVTGGAGFIGSHLTAALRSQETSVTVLDDLRSGKWENLAQFEDDPDCEMITGDMTDPGILRDAMEGAEVVYHLGAIPSVPHSVDFPVESHHVNLSATVRVLETARDLAVSRVVFASSCAVYGDGDAPLNAETDQPAALSPYALQKFASEEYARLFHDLCGLETVSLRYFNIFGPQQPADSAYSGVIAKFCTDMLDGDRPTIFGDGSQSRDFNYVANVVDANLLAAQAPAEKVAGRVFNIAGGQPVNLRQLVDEINRINETDIEAIFAEPRPGDILHSAADLSQARELLAYEPRVSWQDGLKSTLDFYRSQISRAS